MAAARAVAARAGKRDREGRMVVVGWQDDVADSLVCVDVVRWVVGIKAAYIKLRYSVPASYCYLWC